MSKEAMQMALEALDLLAKWQNPFTKWQVRKPKDGGPIVTIYPHKVATDAAIALRQALETKREWVGLTDEDRKSFYKNAYAISDDELIERVEAKLKEKNT